MGGWVASCMSAMVVTQLLYMACMSKFRAASSAVHCQIQDQNDTKATQSVLQRRSRLRVTHPTTLLCQHMVLNRVHARTCMETERSPRWGQSVGIECRLHLHAVCGVA